MNFVETSWTTSFHSEVGSSGRMADTEPLGLLRTYQKSPQGAIESFGETKKSNFNPDTILVSLAAQLPRAEVTGSSPEFKDGLVT